MARLIIKKGILDRCIEEYTVPTGLNVAEWMMDNLERPEAVVKLFLNSVSTKTEIPEKEIPALISKPDDILILVHFPGWPAVPYILALAAIVLAIVLRPKLPPPPNEFEDDTRSPNNEIAGQKNLLRPGARIPDILGTVRSWPDLLTPSYSIWSGELQVVTEYFCVGVGEYVVNRMRLGDTFVETLNTAVAVTYSLERDLSRPEVVTSVIESSQVDALPLLEVSDIITLDIDVAFDATTNRITITSGIVPKLNIGQYFTIKDGAAATTPNNGMYKIKTVIASVSPYIYEIATPNAITTTEVGKLLAYRVYHPKQQAWITFNTVGDVSSVNSSLSFGLQIPFPEYTYLGLEAENPSINIIVYFEDFEKAGPSGEIIDVLFPKAPNGYILWASYKDSFFSPAQGPYFLFRQIGGGIPAWNRKGTWGWFGEPLGRVLVTLFREFPNSNWLGPFHTPSIDPDEIWVDIRFPRGNYIQEAGDPKGEFQVSYTIRIQALSDTDDTLPVGTEYTKTFLRSLNSVDPLQYTETFTIDHLVSNSEQTGFLRKNKYQVRVRREGPRQQSDENTIVVDDMVWASLRSARHIVAPDFGDVTTVLLTIGSSTLISTLEDTTFNVIAQRKLPDYTLGPGNTAKRPSNKWLDGFVYRALAKDGGQFSYTELDIEGYLSIQSFLDTQDGGKAGEMSLTLDRYQDINKELSNLANVIRGIAYRFGEKLFVVRDQKQTTEAVSLYNRRNKAPKAEVLSLEFLGKSGIDGIEYEFFDSDNDHKAMTFVYPTTSTESNLKRVKGDGVRHWAQAWRRAVYEWEILQRRIDNLTLEVLEDPRVLSPLDKVKVVDNIDCRGMMDGEILDIDFTEKEIFLDKNVSFEINETYTLWVRGIEVDGEAQIEAIPVTIGGALNSIKFTSISIQLASRNQGSNNQTGSLYSFAADSSDMARDYLLLGYDLTTDGFTTMSCVEYDETVYDGDTASLPLPPSPPE